MGVLAVAAVGGIVTVPLIAGAQPAGHLGSKTTLQRVKVGKYGEVLADAGGFSLYVLSAGSKGTRHCTSSACLAGWQPVLVAKNTMITAGAGVKGKVSDVTRGSPWQVNCKGWPLYTFVGDSGPGKSAGEEIVAFGGTWYLAHAGATTNSGTPVETVAKSRTTTTGGGGATTTTATSHGY